MASRPERASTQIPPSPQRCRVLIVDDSAVARMIVQRIVNETDEFEVAGQAANAAEAAEKLVDLSVDMILLDVEMPGVDGIEAIPMLLERSGGASILIVSSHCMEDAEASVRAMTMGASDTLFKPQGRAFAGAFSKELAAAMRRIAAKRDIPSIDSAAAPENWRKWERSGRDLARPVRCLAVGASTGGLHALSHFFSALPRELDMPILVTQHLPSDFIDFFARQMQPMTGRAVTVARDGQEVGPAMVLVAPGDAHLAVVASDAGSRVHFRRRPVASGCCPSVDPMLESVADVYGKDAVGVVLSGMGKDGADGARALAECGGELLVQDPASSVIWGMPGAIAHQGIAHRIAPPADLADYVARRARKFGWK